jgi:hypothetical protein
LIAAPQNEKYCFAPCPEGVPCSCKARVIVSFDIDFGKMPNIEPNVQVSDTTGDEQRTKS